VSLALTIYVVIALIGLIYMRQVAVPHWKAAREASAELFGFIEEQLAGTEDIRSSGAVPYSMRNLFKFNKQRLEKETVAGVMNILVVMMWIGFYTLGQAIALVAGFYLFQENALTIGSVYLIIYYTDAIFRPLREITNEIQNLQKAAAGIDRVENLFALESIIPNSRIDKLPAGPLGVQFNDVSFEYAQGKRTLQELSFELLPGEVLGILGRTGSGKSTITRLLFRLYDPTTGAIRFGANGNAIDIRETSLDDLRNHVGMVTQDVQLFRASVRDNLTFFDKTFRDEQLLEVIEQLELSHWYDNLKDGLDTELETEGTSLSAGEGQLLAFTRVFLKDPGLVILDEASSRLDPATERYIERAVSKLLKDRTGIIVAHRLETVERADKILILEAGQIQEFGKYEDLAKDKNSRFATLLKTGLREVLV
jgi:ABC-type multidrug transport system fused ATPase/permease subunit